MSDIRLTQREREVLVLAASGLSDRAIAARLYIAVKTVNHHMSNILEKLDATCRTESVVTAVRLGLIDLPPPAFQAPMTQMGNVPLFNVRAAGA